MNVIASCSLLATLFIFFRSANAQDPCLTPAAKPGVCVVIDQCEPLSNLLKGPRPIPQDYLDFLRQSHCGFQGLTPKVCCATVGATPAPEPAPTTEEPTEVPSPPDVSNHQNLQLLPHDICGPLTQGRIVGGNKTGVFDFPWMTLLAYTIGDSVPEFRCGGTLINKRYVLTAAHCVTALTDGLTLIGARVGDHDISKERDCDKDEFGMELSCAEKYQDYGIESVHFHPGYTRAKLHNDIALIRLNGDADFRPKNVKPICLPVHNPVLPKKVIVTGWGATEVSPRSRDLLKVSLAPVPAQQCKDAYKREVEIWYKQLCAGGTKSKDSCLGDSGGPLQAPGPYTNKKFRYIQHGVVSFGMRTCGVEGFPGVYTNIKYYMDWILNTIRP